MNEKRGPSPTACGACCPRGVAALAACPIERAENKRTPAASPTAPAQRGDLAPQARQRPRSNSTGGAAAIEVKSLALRGLAAKAPGLGSPNPSRFPLRLHPF